MIDQTILQQNIITALGIESLPDERKIALIDKMAELVQKRISLRLMEGLSESDAESLAKLESGSQEQKTEFLQAKFPNLADIIQEEIVAVKNAVLEAGKVD